MSRLDSIKQRNARKIILALAVISVILLIVLPIFGFRLIIQSIVGVRNLISPDADSKNAKSVESTFRRVSLDEPPQATNSSQLKISGNGTDVDIIDVLLNGDSLKKITLKEEGTFETIVTGLKEGENTIAVQGLTRSGKRTDPTDLHTVLYKKEPLTLEVTKPSADSKTNKDEIEVAGTTDPGSTVTVNTSPAVVDTVGTFSTLIRLKEGENTITVKATDVALNEKEIVLKVSYQRE